MAPRFLSVFLIVGLLFPSFSIASEPAEIHEGIVEIPFVALILKPSDPLIFAALYQLSETELFVLCGADEGIISCWDSNHLMSLVVNSLSYDAYDPQGVRKSATYDDGLNPAVTTAYPTQYFNTDGTTIKEHIVVNGIPVATVERVGTGNPTIFWNSQDHLRSTSVVTDANAGIAESVEYFAFGSIKSNTGAHKEQRKYTGHEFDILSKYTYAQSRYLDTKVGRFLSEDAAFLLIGDQGFEDRYNRTLEQFLADPQLLNSYSYARNNPLKFTDPDGEIGETILDILSALVSAYTLLLHLYQQQATWGDVGNLAWDVGSIAIPFVPGSYIAKIGRYGDEAAKAGVKAFKKIDRLPDETLVCRGGTCNKSHFENAVNIGTVKKNPDGTLSDVSVNSYPGVSEAELAKGFKNRQYGVTTVGQIRRLGGDVIPSQREFGSPYHATIEGLGIDQLIKVFDIRIKP